MKKWNAATLTFAHTGLIGKHGEDAALRAEKMELELEWNLALMKIVSVTVSLLYLCSLQIVSFSSSTLARKCVWPKTYSANSSPNPYINIIILFVYL